MSKSKKNPKEISIKNSSLPPILPTASHQVLILQNDDWSDDEINFDPEEVPMEDVGSTKTQIDSPARENVDLALVAQMMKTTVRKRHNKVFGLFSFGRHKKEKSSKIGDSPVSSPIRHTVDLESPSDDQNLSSKSSPDISKVVPPKTDRLASNPISRVSKSKRRLVDDQSSLSTSHSGSPTLNDRFFVSPSLGGSSGGQMNSLSSSPQSFSTTLQTSTDDENSSFLVTGSGSIGYSGATEDQSSNIEVQAHLPIFEDSSQQPAQSFQNSPLPSPISPSTSSSSISIFKNSPKKKKNSSRSLCSEESDIETKSNIQYTATQSTQEKRARNKRSVSSGDMGKRSIIRNMNDDGYFQNTKFGGTPPGTLRSSDLADTTAPGEMLTSSLNNISTTNTSPSTISLHHHHQSIGPLKTNPTSLSKKEIKELKERERQQKKTHKTLQRELSKSVSSMKLQEKEMKKKEKRAQKERLKAEKKEKRNVSSSVQISSSLPEYMLDPDTLKSHIAALKKSTETSPFSAALAKPNIEKVPETSSEIRVSISSSPKEHSHHVRAFSDTSITPPTSSKRSESPRSQINSAIEMNPATINDLESKLNGDESSRKSKLIQRFLNENQTKQEKRTSFMNLQMLASGLDDLMMEFGSDDSNDSANSLQSKLEANVTLVKSSSTGGDLNTSKPRFEQMAQIESQSESDSDFEDSDNSDLSSSSSSSSSESSAKNSDTLRSSNSSHYQLSSKISVELLKRIGKGSTGVVWQGLIDGRKVAIKQIELYELSPKKQLELRTKSKREVDLLKSLKCNNIVRYHAMFYSKANQQITVIMELVEGISVTSFVLERIKLSEKFAAYIVYETLKGLEYLHANNIIHRDIKPDNLLIDVHSTVKIIDFGTACSIDPLKINARRSTVGTPWYCAPEVIKTEEYSYPADIWSLGCTLIELVTGKPPYDDLKDVACLFKMAEGNTPPLPTTVSQACQDFLKQCLDPSPEKRPTPTELLNHPFVKSIQQDFETTRNDLKRLITKIMHEKAEKSTM